MSKVGALQEIFEIGQIAFDTDRGASITIDPFTDRMIQPDMFEAEATYKILRAQLVCHEHRVWMCQFENVLHKHVQATVWYDLRDYA